MKKIVLLGLLFFFSISVAQEKLVTKTGKITFEASVPSFEEVKATTESATCILYPKKGEINSLVIIKEFRFKLALMEQHFNENYIESDDYPKSTFKGKIKNFDEKKLTEVFTNYTIKGKIELHGYSKEISIVAKIRKRDNVIEIMSNFILDTDDFKISIPSIVKSKVSNKVYVSTNFTFNYSS
jgi:hypothetical protein